MLRRHGLLFAIAIGAISLGGCATTEGVAESAINTNLELEQIQNKSVLLNTVRASLRRPPVYQTLSAVNASVRPAGDLTLAVPFGVNVSTANTATLSLKGNEGPKLTTAPLDTQEFYQGITAPIKVATIDFYLQQGYPRALLYNLFFSKIELRRGKEVVTVKNYPGDDIQLALFQSLIDRLIALGMTSEPVPGGASEYGPLRTGDQVTDLAATAAAAAAGLSISKRAKCEGEKKKDDDCTEAGHEDMYKITKSSAATSARLCFERTADTVSIEGLPHTCSRTGETKLNLNPAHLAVAFEVYQRECIAREEKRPGGKPARCNGAEIRSLLCGEKDATAEAKARETACIEGTVPAACSLNPDKNATNKKKNDADCPQVNVSFVVRSTDGIIYYLGEIARRRLYPDPDARVQVAKRTIGYRRGQKYDDAHEVSCALKNEDGDEWNDPNCHAIFWVDQGTDLASGAISVDYEGTTFSVPGSVPKHGAAEHPGRRSSQIFGIVSQLLALNKAAKDQPNTSILNVVNP
jgi:hypothetical protein